MPAPEIVIPLLEGTVGSVAGVDEAAALWVKQMKDIMLMTSHKDLTDWAFINIPDIDEASTAAGGQAPESGARLYGVLYAHSDAAAISYTAVCDDADGTIAAFDTAGSRVTDVPLIQLGLPAAATDGTEEFWGVAIAKGLPFTNFMTFVGDQSGTQIGDNQLRAWCVYRTVVTIGF
jgi:hypothetical protein